MYRLGISFLGVRLGRCIITQHGSKAICMKFGSIRSSLGRYGSCLASQKSHSHTPDPVREDTFLMALEHSLLYVVLGGNAENSAFCHPPKISLLRSGLLRPRAIRRVVTSVWVQVSKVDKFNHVLRIFSLLFLWWGSSAKLCSWPLPCVFAIHGKLLAHRVVSWDSSFGLKPGNNLPGGAPMGTS